jgi:retinol dehydrogenase-12
MTFHPDSLPDLSGKVYIVTGATSGMYVTSIFHRLSTLTRSRGYHTAARLAQHNAHVYICARTPEKGATTRSRIQSTYPHANLTILTMDHLQLSTVVAAATSFLSLENRLDGLVNNAGIMASPFCITDDGYEAQWQTNYLAHWVLTSHLLPLLLATSRKNKHASQVSVRIVNLSSSGHYLSAPKNGINFTDTSLKHASGMTRYGQSKLANILHIKTLHAQFGPNSPSATSGTGAGEIWVSAVHPGLVKSELGAKAELPGLMKVLLAPYRWAGGEFDGDKGSWTSLYCVASEEMKREECGRYFQRVADPNGWQSATAKDEKLAEELEEWTKTEMVKGGWVIV